MKKLLRRLFLIEFFASPYYIARGNTLYHLNGDVVPTYDGNDRKWHPNWEEQHGRP